MSSNISYWILQTISMLLTAAILPKLRVTSIFGAVGMVVALSAVNATIWDAALFFSVPDSPTLHTATLLLSNGALFWILVKLLPGIEIDGILTAFIAPIIFTVTSLFISAYGKDIDWEKLASAGLQKVQEWRDEMKSPIQSQAQRSRNF